MSAQNTTSNASTLPVDGSNPVQAYGDDKNFPQTAKEAPISGILPSEGVPFKDQVAGHAKYFAGIVTRNDKEVQEGAARVRGDELINQPNQSADSTGPSAEETTRSINDGTSDSTSS
ncbi:hypothetical protein OC845_003659 [Tilletia horrida]|nr:hypothetical protein OC845_003659 [Tilletia horrida]